MSTAAPAVVAPASTDSSTASSTSTAATGAAATGVAGELLPDLGSPTYTPKNILVTGGAGFIGSHLVLHLVRKYPQYRIVVLDKLDYCSSLQHLASVSDQPNYKFIKADVLNVDLVVYLLREEAIDTIFHLAAQTHVDNSFGNSLSFTATNVLGTHVLLEAAKGCGVRRFIHISTDEVYGEIEMGQNHASEEKMLEPTNPYAATKAGAEFLCKSYWRSFHMPIIVTRSSNIYGPHQYPEKVIPKFISLLMRNRPCTIHGDGSHRRNYLYVDDVVAAYDMVLHHGTVGQVYNIGTTFELSNLSLAEQLLTRFGVADRRAELLVFVADRAFNDRRYAIDSARITAMGWRPKVAWEDGLQRTIDWYRDHAATAWADFDSALVAHPRAAAPLTSSTPGTS